MSHTLDTSGHTIFDIVLLYENLYPLLDKEILIVYWGPFVLFESSWKPMIVHLIYAKLYTIGAIIELCRALVAGYSLFMQLVLL